MVKITDIFTQLEKNIFVGKVLSMKASGLQLLTNPSHVIWCRGRVLTGNKIIPVKIFFKANCFLYCTVNFNH